MNETADADEAAMPATTHAQPTWMRTSLIVVGLLVLVLTVVLSRG